MRYMFINISNDNIQVDLYNPEVSHRRRGLNRPAPVLALNIKKGTSVDILPYFKGSYETAHRCIEFSKHLLHAVKHNQLRIGLFDDNGGQIDQTVRAAPQLEDSTHIEYEVDAGPELEVVQPSTIAEQIEDFQVSIVERDPSIREALDNSVATLRSFKMVELRDMAKKIHGFKVSVRMDKDTLIREILKSKELVDVQQDT